MLILGYLIRVTENSIGAYFLGHRVFWQHTHRQSRLPPSDIIDPSVETDAYDVQPAATVIQVMPRGCHRLIMYITIYTTCVDLLA